MERLMRDAKPTPKAPFAPRNDLSPTEKEILALIAQGWTAREAADHVSLGIRTVERYIENLRMKMNARNTAHLVACGFATGVLKAVRGVARVKGE
jgi:LuxR family transcriptional regulator of spore coat protein